MALIGHSHVALTSCSWAQETERLDEPRHGQQIPDVTLVGSAGGQRISLKYFESGKVAAGL
jgi:hypothetical protein